MASYVKTVFFDCFVNETSLKTNNKIKFLMIKIFQRIQLKVRKLINFIFRDDV